MAKTTDFKASYKLYMSGIMKEKAKGARATAIEYSMYRASYEKQKRLNTITYARRYNPETGKYESTGRTLAENKESIVKQLIRQSIDVTSSQAKKVRKEIVEAQLEEMGMTGSDRPNDAKIRRMIAAGEIDAPSIQELKSGERTKAFFQVQEAVEKRTGDEERGYREAEEIFYPDKAARRGMPKEQRQAERKAQREALAALMKRGS